MTVDGQVGRWPVSAIPAAYMRPGNGSFTEFLTAAEPHLLPGHGARQSVPALAGAAPIAVPHGTTIVAVTCQDGVVIAGDRRATMGNIIAQRDIEKVFVADTHSAIGIAGTAGLAVELVRLFRLELEHYEKIEGIRLSLDGKANRLATMIRGNLSMAMQGLAVVPLFAGIESDQVPDPAFDVARRDPRRGRIFSYDVAGGKYEEHDYYAVGSGSTFARSALKKRYDSAADVPTAVRAAVEALYDAADDDSATGGPDLTRRIFPVVVAITVDGAVRWSDDEVGVVAEAVVAGRMVNPGG